MAASHHHRKVAIIEATWTRPSNTLSYVQTTPARAFSRTQERKSWKYIGLYFLFLTWSMLNDLFLLFQSFSHSTSFFLSESSETIIFFFIRQMRRDKFRPNQTRTDQFIRSKLSWIHIFASQKKRMYRILNLMLYSRRSLFSISSQWFFIFDINLSTTVYIRSSVDVNRFTAIDIGCCCCAERFSA